MDLISHGRFRVGQVAWQTELGECYLTIACKLTYRLAPGTSPIAGMDEQEALNEEDAYWNDDPNRSLSAASDLAPFKVGADILLVGHAFAPAGTPARAIVARICVAGVDKSIDVWCDRGFALDGSLLEGARFTKMPLTWERAAGGPGTSNPVGMRFDARPNAYGVVAIPNLQPAGRLISCKGETFEPVGYGPVAPSWPGRANKLYRHMAGWDHDRWYDRPFPRDIDSAYFNSAPPDQQVERLHANERIVLEGLLSDHPRLVTRLEEAAPRVVVEFADRGSEVPGLSCDTLTIDTDRGLCMVVWRALVALRSLHEAGRVVVSESETPGFDAEVTVVPSPEEIDAVSEAVLPFRQPGPAMSEAMLAAGVPAHLVTKANMPLPEGGETLKLAVPSAPAQKVLPFGKDMEEALRGLKPEDTITVVQKTPELKSAQIPAPAAAPVPEEPMPGLPAPPPHIGPIAMVDAPPRAEEPVHEEPVAPVVESPAPPEPEIPQISLEKCAEITASIARTKGDESRILKENKLTKKAWEDVKAHWNEEVRKETARGKSVLLKRFDGAYVEQLERERGTINVEEYARISVAMERGTVDEVFAELGLPRGALMRIERVWAGRMAKDGVLEARVRDAVEGERE